MRPERVFCKWTQQVSTDATSPSNPAQIKNIPETLLLASGAQLQLLKAPIHVSHLGLLALSRRAAALLIGISTCHRYLLIPSEEPVGV